MRKLTGNSLGPYYNIANAKPDKGSTFHEKKKSKPSKPKT